MNSKISIFSVLSLVAFSFSAHAVEKELRPELERHSVVCKSYKEAKRFASLYQIPYVSLAANSTEAQYSKAYIQAIAAGDENIADRLSKTLRLFESVAFKMVAPEEIAQVSVEVNLPDECKLSPLSIAHGKHAIWDIMISDAAFGQMTVQERAQFKVDLVLTYLHAARTEGALENDQKTMTIYQFYNQFDTVPSQKPINVEVAFGKK